PSRDEERDLVERAKRDPRQFGALYDRHFQPIYRFVYSRVREQTAAEDVTSEVFMKALKAMPRYQDTGRPFAAWLYQIAVNAIADRYRTLRPAQTLDDFHDLSVAGPSMDDLAAHRDELRRIWALVESLPNQQRTALVLKFQEDMKIEDIAVAMGKSAGAGLGRSHRGPAADRVPRHHECPAAAWRLRSGRHPRQRGRQSQRRAPAAHPRLVQPAHGPPVDRARGANHARHDGDLLMGGEYTRRAARQRQPRAQHPVPGDHRAGGQDRHRQEGGRAQTITF